MMMMMMMIPALFNNSLVTGCEFLDSGCNLDEESVRKVLKTTVHPKTALGQRNVYFVLKLGCSWTGRGNKMYGT